MCPHTVIPARPPGRRTRRRSASASGVVPQIPRKLVTTSNDASSQGSACMSPTLISASGVRSRATATSRGEASMPQQAAPRARASSIASPDPQATSSSRSPASTPRRWCMETYSRQLLGSLSGAKSTALRPQPASTRVHWGGSVSGVVIDAPLHQAAPGCASPYGVTRERSVVKRAGCSAGPPSGSFGRMARSATGESVLSRAVRIFEAFTPDERVLSVSQIARRARLHLATASRLIAELEAHGLLDREPDRRVRVGVRMWELALRASPTLGLRDASMPFMEDAHAVLGHHVQLGVLDGDQVLFVERLSAPGAVINYTRIAGRLPLHASSSGLVLLAFGRP